MEIKFDKQQQQAGWFFKGGHSVSGGRSKGAASESILRVVFFSCVHNKYVLTGNGEGGGFMACR